MHLRATIRLPLYTCIRAVRSIHWARTPRLIWGAWCVLGRTIALDRTLVVRSHLVARAQLVAQSRTRAIRISACEGFWTRHYFLHLRHPFRTTQLRLKCVKGHQTTAVWSADQPTCPLRLSNLRTRLYEHRRPLQCASTAILGSPQRVCAGHMVSGHGSNHLILALPLFVHLAQYTRLGCDVRWHLGLSETSICLPDYFDRSSFICIYMVLYLAAKKQSMTWWDWGSVVLFGRLVRLVRLVRPVAL